MRRRASNAMYLRRSAYLCMLFGGCVVAGFTIAVNVEAYYLFGRVLDPYGIAMVSLLSLNMGAIKLILLHRLCCRMQRHSAMVIFPGILVRGHKRSGHEGAGARSNEADGPFFACTEKLIHCFPACTHSSAHVLFLLLDWTRTWAVNLEPCALCTFRRRPCGL